MKPNYIHNLRGIPLALNSCIMGICFFQWGAILVFKAQGLMMMTNLWCNLLFCMFVHRLNLMEITSSLLIHHGFNGIPTTMYMIFTTFQLTWVMLAMKPLKFGLVTPFFDINLFNFCKRTYWMSMSLDYMSYMAIVITL